jgi:hypothetical protein
MKENWNGTTTRAIGSDESYPVKKEVGKVGEDSPLFIVPIDSAENKSNIANFFSKPQSPAKAKSIQMLVEEKAEDKSAGEDVNSETHAPGKRKAEEMSQEIQMKEEDSPSKKVKVVEVEMKGQSPVKTAQRKPTKRAPPPTKKSPVKKEGSSKITSFFGVK